MKTKTSSIIVMFFLWIGTDSIAQDVLERKVIPAGGSPRVVPGEVMAQVFAEVKTPFKIMTGMALINSSGSTASTG